MVYGFTSHHVSFTAVNAGLVGGYSWAVRWIRIGALVKRTATGTGRQAAGNGYYYNPKKEVSI